jgi:hypothetical protein
MKFNISNENAIRLAEVFGRALENRDMDLFYSAFTQHFKDRSDFETCLNNLNSEKSDIARLGYFYYVATKEIRHAGVVLIAIFSIMEATATEEFKSFDQWLFTIRKDDESITYPITDQNHFKKLISSLQKQYYLQYGSSQKVRSFIKNYFDIADKQSLIGGLQIKNTHLNSESIDLDSKLKIVVNMLYNERNAFVHKARLPQISDQDVRMSGICKVGKKDISVSIQISINKIKNMFERAFVKFIKERGAFNQRLQKDR